MSTATIQPIRSTVIHWVDVRDHLPADDRTVLVHAPQECPPVWPGWYDEQESCWMDADGGLLEGVTDWAELPQPPEAKP